MKTKWKIELYGSGTVVVTRNDGGPHFYVGHAAEDNDGEHERYYTGKAIEAFMNGGEINDRIKSTLRIDGEAVGLKNGCVIRATGPMIPSTTPPQFGLWMEDPSDDAKIARGLLADALYNLKPTFTTL